MKPGKRALPAILLAAFLLRAGLAIFYPSIAFPDEIFQYQEPAHVWLTGRGVPTWEWHEHVRSWLIPELVLPVMAAARLVTHNPAFYRAVMDILLSAASLPAVWVAFAWGREQGGRRGAIVAGWLAAVAFQPVYFSAHLLMDTAAADVLLPALYACRAYRQGGGAPHLRWGAVLLALAAYLRPQIAPALLLPAAVTLLAAHRRHETRACLAWSLGPFALLGLWDWVTLGTPFQSIWLYARVNLASSGTVFGTSPWYWYLGLTLVTWSAAIVPIAALTALAARRLRLELAVALLILVTMSAIGHKEPRFIYPAQLLVLTLTGAGIALWQSHHRGWFASNRFLLPAIALCSLALAVLGPFRAQIAVGHTMLALKTQIMNDPKACGIYFRSSGPYRPYLGAALGSAGYTLTRDGIKLTDDTFDSPANNIRHANYIMTLPKKTEKVPVPDNYTREGCGREASGYQVCIYKRPGNCDGGGI